MTTEIRQIYLTEAAEKKVKEFLQKRKKGIGIKVGVKTTGCSGLAYTLEFVDKLDGPELYWMGGKDVMVAALRKDFVYLEGTVIDWVRNGLNEGFEFKNPNERDRCGCGESFRV